MLDTQYIIYILGNPRYSKMYIPINIAPEGVASKVSEIFKLLKTSLCTSFGSSLEIESSNMPNRSISNTCLEELTNGY